MSKVVKDVRKLDGLRQYQLLPHSPVKLLTNHLRHLALWQSLREEGAVGALKPANASNVSAIDRVPIATSPGAIQLLNLVHARNIRICRCHLLRTLISIELEVKGLSKSIPSVCDKLLPIPDRRLLGEGTMSSADTTGESHARSNITVEMRVSHSMVLEEVSRCPTHE
jgi:hypothetical protein